MECVLTELLAAGVAEDVGPQLQKFKDAPATVAAAYAQLPPDAQEQLDCFLPAFDVARSDRLRNPSLYAALSDVAESLDETPTPAALQRRRNKSWNPAVGDRCEGRYRAAKDGLARRTEWFEGEILRVTGGGRYLYHVRYDDGDEEDG